MRMCEPIVLICVVLLGLCGRAAVAQEKAPAAGPPAGPPGLARRIKVVADKAPDCSSLKSIVATVTRGWSPRLN